MISAADASTFLSRRAWALAVTSITWLVRTRRTECRKPSAYYSDVPYNVRHPLIRLSFRKCLFRTDLDYLISLPRRTHRAYRTQVDPAFPGAPYHLSFLNGYLFPLRQQ